MFLFGCTATVPLGSVFYYISVQYGPPFVVHYVPRDAPCFFSMNKTTAILEAVAKQRATNKGKIKKFESNCTSSIRHHHSNSKTNYFALGFLPQLWVVGFFFSFLLQFKSMFAFLKFKKKNENKKLPATSNCLYAEFQLKRHLHPKPSNSSNKTKTSFLFVIGSFDFSHLRHFKHLFSDLVFK